MSLAGPWTIGVCAVGGPETPPPSPGQRAHLTVTVTHEDGHTETWHHVWDGYTPAEAYRHRLTGLREAKARLTADKATLTITRDRDREVGILTETLTFTAMDGAS